MSDKAFVTLLTKISYLPGTLVLAKDLNCVQSKYPLVVMVTPQLPAEAGDVLLRRGIIVRVVESLQPMEGGHTLAAHDTRFADTWTKLRYSCLGLFFFFFTDIGDIPIRGFELVEYNVYWASFFSLCSS